jgi:hypothetical protein
MGDRLGIIIALSAFARLYDNSTVYMEWCTDTRRVLVGNPLHMKYIPGWRGYEYTLDSVHAHIEQCQVFLVRPRASVCFPACVGRS